MKTLIKQKQIEQNTGGNGGAETIHHATHLSQNLPKYNLIGDIIADMSAPAYISITTQQPEVIIDLCDQHGSIDKIKQGVMHNLLFYNIAEQGELINGEFVPSGEPFETDIYFRVKSSELALIFDLTDVRASQEDDSEQNYSKYHLVTIPEISGAVIQVSFTVTEIKFYEFSLPCIMLAHTTIPKIETGEEEEGEKE